MQIVFFYAYYYQFDGLCEKHTVYYILTTFGLKVSFIFSSCRKNYIFFIRMSVTACHLIKSLIQ